MARRYQEGTLELRPTSSGPCWYIRFNNPAGVTPARPRFRIGLKKELPSESKASRAAQYLRDRFNDSPNAVPQRRFADVIARYLAEELPARWSTAETYKAMLRNHIEPRWADVQLDAIKPIDIRAWLQDLHSTDAKGKRKVLSTRTRGHVRDLMRVLFRYAMLWEWIPASVNPMTLFRLEGSTRRKAKPRSLTKAEFNTLLVELKSEPTRTMVIVAACLGLRCSEIGALRWRDINWMEGIIHVRNAIVHGHLDKVKTEASEKALPLHPSLAAVLQQYRSTSDYTEPDDFIFASYRSMGEKPWAMTPLQFREIRPAGVRAGLGDGIGWHTFRHSYRSWLRQAGIDPEEQRDLMRHTDITTTLNVYGDTFTEELRKANEAVISGLIQ